MYYAYYGKVRQPGREDVVGWGVNSRPSSQTSTTKTDAEGLRTLRGARAGTVDRREADRQIDAIVQELMR